jgi:hypothetical protein
MEAMLMLKRNGNKRLLPIFLILAVGCLLMLCGCVHGKANRVAVRAEANEEFLLDRSRNYAKKVQTYHVLKGQYFGGNIADASMDEMDFQFLAEHLGQNLKRQNFYSEDDPNEGDLLIMVHYGSTNYVGDSNDSGVYSIDDLSSSYGEPEGGIFDSDLSEVATPSFLRSVPPSQRRILKERYARAKLVGMDDIYSSKVTDYEAFVQQELAREGRYFIILTAFDLPLLRQGEKKIHWSTRYSIRTIGQPFDQAIQELNFVAGHYFGNNMKGLISKRATDDSNVEVGDIEVIGGEEESK